MPQYCGYSFFVLHDEIVTVEPATYTIVVLPRSAGSTAAAPAPSRSKVSFTDSHVLNFDIVLSRG